MLIALALCGCERSKSHELDLDAIRVTSSARLRTDTIGGGAFTSTATFVLVDTQNTAGQGAYVTLGGELDDAAGKRVGGLAPQSLWIPGGETRTFALIDAAREARPTASAAKIVVRGALVPASPPPIRVEHLREIADDGKIVVQGIVTSAAARPGKVLVIASFHDANHQPMTRPFSVIRIPAHAHQAVQFVGPPGSKHGTIFLGEMTF
jgi:hypothetical protein